MDDTNKSIKCDVERCKHNDSSCGYCTLNEIKISSSCAKCKNKEETICDSFKCNCGYKDNTEE